MNIDFQILEKELSKKQHNSVEDFLEYVLLEIYQPAEDYWHAAKLLKEKYSIKKDIRIAILGSYISSTWICDEKNLFLNFLEEHLLETSDQNKAIIYYLMAYDIYMKVDKKYPPEYKKNLQKSIYHSNRFVYNYVQLAEIVSRQEARVLFDKAISNVEVVWSEDQLKKLPIHHFLQYNNFIDEYILGVNITCYTYNELIFKRKHPIISDIKERWI